MTHLALEAVGGGDLQVLGQDWLVIRVGALLNDQLGAILGSQATAVGQTLLGDHAVQVVLGVVDVRAVRNHAGDAGRVGLGGT